MHEKTILTRGITLALIATIAMGSSAGRVRAGGTHPQGRAYLYDRAPDPVSVDGVHVPNRREWGYYPPKWRAWPTAVPAAGDPLRPRATRDDLPAIEIPDDESGIPGAAAPPQQERPLGPRLPRTTPPSTGRDPAPTPPRDTENTPPVPPGGLRDPGQRPLFEQRPLIDREPLFDQRPLFEREPPPATPPLRGPFRRNPIDGPPNSSNLFRQGSSKPPVPIFQRVATEPPPAAAQRPTAKAQLSLLGDWSSQDRPGGSNILRSTGEASFKVVAPPRVIEPARAASASRIQRVSFTGPEPSTAPAKQPTMIANPLR